MNSYYIKITLRNLTRNKLFSSINIFGLVVGLTGFILITLWVRYELSYDLFHENRENIYRVSVSVETNGQSEKLAMSPPGYGPRFTETFSAVENYARIMPWRPVAITAGEKKFSQSIHFADGSLFEFFSFPVILGDRETILREPFTAALSERTARKYFGDENPIGKVLNFNDQYDVTVTGVFADVPENSHIQFDFLISLNTLEHESQMGPGALDIYHAANFYTYVLFRNGTSPNDIKEPLQAFLDRYVNGEQPVMFRPFFEPLTDIYLYSDTKYAAVSGDIRYVYIFSAIAILIIFIAAVNFMNLTTARSMHRAREVGIRKVSGSDRFSLIRQFLGESVIFSMIAFLFALVFVELVLPSFRTLAQLPESVHYAGDLTFIGFIFAVAILIGLFAGCYPAFYLSGFQPARILKGAFHGERSQTRIRKVLVVFQFSIVIGLIFATITIYQQLRHFQSVDIGYDRENLLYFQTTTPSIQSRTEEFKNELMRHPSILHASSTHRVIGNVYGGWSLTLEPGARYDVTALFVDEDFFKTFGLVMKSGRSFDPAFPTDRFEALIINETAAAALGLLEPVGAYAELENVMSGNIIGIVKDFNFESLHVKPVPMVITNFPNDRFKQYMNVRIAGNDIPGAVEHLKNTWSAFESEIPFSFRFMNEYHNFLYRTEERTAKIVLYFAIFAAILGGLGLFGLSAFAAERRTKEMGIRKTLGAAAPQLVTLLTWDFIKLILIANVIVWPFAWFIMNNWLENFAYRVSLEPWLFVLVAVVSTIIALATVSFQAVRAAVANPVEALRYE